MQDCLRNAAHALVRPGGIAAFSVEVAARGAAAKASGEMEEALVVMIEIKREISIGRMTQEALTELTAFVRSTVRALAPFWGPAFLCGPDCHD